MEFMNPHGYHNRQRQCNLRGRSRQLRWGERMRRGAVCQTTETNVMKVRWVWVLAAWFAVGVVGALDAGATAGGKWIVAESVAQQRPAATKPAGADSLANTWSCYRSM